MLPFFGLVGIAFLALIPPAATPPFGCSAALATPLSVAGTAEELDAELPSALVQFVGAHLELRNTLEAAKEQMAAAAETKKPADAAPKPAEPSKPEPARNASLFDIGSVPESAPSSSSDMDEEEEILADTDDEPTDEPDNLDEAA